MCRTLLILSKLRSVSKVSLTNYRTPASTGTIHLTQPHPHAQKRKHCRSLTVMPWITMDELNVIYPKTKRMSLTSFAETKYHRCLPDVGLEPDVETSNYKYCQQIMGIGNWIVKSDGDSNAINHGSCMEGGVHGCYGSMEAAWMLWIHGSGVDAIDGNGVTCWMEATWMLRGRCVEATV